MAKKQKKQKHTHDWKLTSEEYFNGGLTWEKKYVCTTCNITKTDHRVAIVDNKLFTTN